MNILNISSINILLAADDAARHRHEGHHGPQCDDAAHQPVQDPGQCTLQQRQERRGGGLEQGPAEEVTCFWL